MASVTLAQLRDKARYRADMQNSQFVADAELNDYINGSMQELYDLLIESRGENYYIDSDTFTTTNTKDYALPNDFYKLLGVDLVLSSTNSVSIRDFDWKERNKFYGAYPFLPSSNFAGFRYQLRANNLHFEPMPPANQTIKVWYIPAATVLVADGDTFEGINGYEEYIVIDAAIKMRIKEESPIDELVYQKDQMKNRIKSISKGRNSDSPPRMQDVSSIGRPWGWN